MSSENQEVTTLCEGGYAMPARPDDGEFVWKVYDRPIEDDEATGESLEAPQSTGKFLCAQQSPRPTTDPPEGAGEGGQSLCGALQPSAPPRVRLAHQCGDVWNSTSGQIHIQICF